MRQVIPVQFMNLNDFSGDSIIALWPNLSATLANDHLVAVPWPVAGYLDNLSIREPFDGVVWTLYVNDAPSALTVTSVADTMVSNASDRVAISVGDRVYYRRTGTSWRPQDDPPICGVLEFESSDDYTSAYCCSPGFQFSGGLFGACGPSGTPVSGTVSLASINGTVTSLVALADFGIVDPAQGLRWTIYKNGVAQDGTGGTVDTVITIMDTVLGPVVDTKAFTLAFVEGDVLECYQEGVNPTGLNHVNSFGVSVEATTANEFMLCGSNPIGWANFNDPTAYGSFPGYWMEGNDPSGTSQDNAALFNGLTPFTLTGLQMWIALPAGTGWGGGDLTMALEVNGAAPANQPTITVTSGDKYVVDSDVAHVVTIDAGDAFITRTDIATTVAAQAHWSYRATTDGSTPPVPTFTTRAIRRLRQFGHFSDKQFWIFWSRFELYLEAGRGLTTGQGDDPQVMISWSNDGGHTWTPEQWVSAGRIGEYRRRVVLNRLGRSRDRVWRIVVSDPIPWTLIDAYGDVTKGTS